jgi:hypothetical protein
MNYREWLVYRAQQHAQTAKPIEPEILRYAAWRNYQALRDWNRRADAHHPYYANVDSHARRPTI